MTKKVKKIIWYSRHDILKSQCEELKRIFGEEIEIMKDPKPFSSAEEAVKRFRESGADEMVVVAPLSVISHMCNQGIRPLWAEMKQVPIDQAEVIDKNRGYKFIKFRRVKRLALEFEDIK